MSVEKSDNMRFCPGCPVQNTHVGVVQEKHTELDIKVSAVDAGQVISTTDEINLAFTDYYNGTSETIPAMAKFDGRPITMQEAQAAAKATIPALVKRIDLCTAVGIRADGQRYCPAFNPTVFQAILDDRLSEADQ